MNAFRITNRVVLAAAKAHFDASHYSKWPPMNNEDVYLADMRVALDAAVRENRKRTTKKRRKT